MEWSWRPSQSPNSCAVVATDWQFSRGGSAPVRVGLTIVLGGLGFLDRSVPEQQTRDNLPRPNGRRLYANDGTKRGAKTRQDQ